MVFHLQKVGWLVGFFMPSGAVSALLDDFAGSLAQGLCGFAISFGAVVAQLYVMVCEWYLVCAGQLDPC